MPTLPQPHRWPLGSDTGPHAESTRPQCESAGQDQMMRPSGRGPPGPLHCLDSCPSALLLGSRKVYLPADPSRRPQPKGSLQRPFPLSSTVIHCHTGALSSQCLIPRSSGQARSPASAHCCLVSPHHSCSSLFPSFSKHDLKKCWLQHQLQPGGCAPFSCRS